MPARFIAMGAEYSARHGSVSFRTSVSSLHGFRFKVKYVPAQSQVHKNFRPGFSHKNTGSFTPFDTEKLEKVEPFFDLPDAET
jgi:hypothetical protein